MENETTETTENPTLVELVAKEVVVGIAITAGTYVGLWTIGYVANKVYEARKTRAAKKIDNWITPE